MNISHQYLAGFLDGEGCFRASIRHRRGSVEASVGIEIAQVNLRILELIRADYGGVITIKQNGVDKDGNALCIYRLGWYNLDDIRALLLIVTPYLICKKPQCDLLLTYTARHSSTSRTRYTDDDWKLLAQIPIANKQQYLAT